MVMVLGVELMMRVKNEEDEEERMKGGSRIDVTKRRRWSDWEKLVSMAHS